MSRWEDWTYTGNLLEAVLWWGVAALLLWNSRRHVRQERNTLLVLACEFAVFGVTDVIESQTGAWWRPWWLLVLKGLCILFLIGGFLRLQRLRRTDKSSQANPRC